MPIQWNTDFCQMMGIRYPLVLAGMAGIANMPTLVAAVSNAGGLGTLGGAYVNPPQLRQMIKEIKAKTDAPFAVNLFAHIGSDQYDGWEAVLKQLEPIRQTLRIPAPARNEIVTPNHFEAQFAVLLEEHVPVISTTFGLLSAMHMQQAKSAGMLVIGTATTVAEAMQAQASGCDVIVAQGSEAGGHRGTFDIRTEPLGSNIGTMALVPQIVDHVRIPVLAAGGIMDGRGLIAALALGAQGVQMGTRFLTSAESGAHEVYKQALLQSTEESTVITNAFSGRPARGICNAFIRHWNTAGMEPLAFPTQNTLTRAIRNAAADQHNPEHMALWAGQGTRLLTDRQPAAEIVQQMMEQAEALLQR
ncbi:nitronate monooxygenase family protein [Paenibacillus campi]|uniref:NAD(P)H-dependent flavin oxidoreductase n=1 Tax=Paenibacillus campi TaxID=3106031 RepID=UPI002AFE5EC5|nr:nitronate monooxygenase family protein [Paenibacillus sp. SGZ-1009]